MAQLSYGYDIPAGVAGGIYGLENYDIVARLNDEETGKMKFGVGVVQGANAGKSVKVPASGATAAQFEGVVVYTANRELTYEGATNLRKGTPLSIMNYGKVWVRVGESASVAYGADAYLITNGDEAGCFTTSADEATKVAIKGRFITDATDGLAVVELFNSKNA